MAAPISRRQAVGGAAVAGIAVPFLAACGSDDGGDTSGANDPTTDPTSDPTADQPSTGGTTGDTGGTAAGLVATADVPVGGGVILDDQELVVTQPAEGEFKAFSAICTHQGCLVTSVEDGSIICPCHASSFDIETGEPTSGPAPSALSSVSVSVDGDQVVEG